MFELMYGQAEQSAPAASQGMGGIMDILPMMLIFFGIMYFLMIRPNQKRERERKDLLASLQKNDRVITMGGVYGTIVGLNENTVTLRVSDDPPVKLEFVRQSISRVLPRDEQKNGKKDK